MQRYHQNLQYSVGDDKKHGKKEMTREEEERQKRKQFLMDKGMSAMDAYDRHSDPKKREAEARRRHQQDETVDRRGGGREKRPGKVQSAIKIGKFFHKHSK